MAELTNPADAPSACCSTDAQASCCDPSDKAACCTPEAATCGCAVGDPATAERDIREVVRQKYAVAASRRGDTDTTTTDASRAEVFGAALYSEHDGVPGAAIAASLGCGVPTAVPTRPL